MRLEVRAPINPTEDSEKVVRCIKNIFKIDVFIERNEAVGVSEDMSSLENLKRLIRQRRIRAAAKAVMRSGVEGDTIIFHLNKQAAYVKKVSFSSPENESPLGTLSVKIETDDPHGLIDWLTE